MSSAAADAPCLPAQPERVPEPIAPDDSPAAVQDMHARLRELLGEDNYQSFAARLDLDRIEGDTARLSLPTRFLKNWVHDHHLPQVRQACALALHVDHVVLTQRSCATAPPVAPAQPSRPAPKPAAAVAAPAAAIAEQQLAGAPLDPRLTFETFVVGRSNTLAHAAARQIADAREGEAPSFNPLFVHGGTGLGKTHLIQAIAAEAAEGGRKPLYLTAETFAHRFAGAVHSHSITVFRELVRGAGLLIVDDLQFLRGERTLGEFLYSLSTLLDGGRQVVIAADTPPGDMESIVERLRSRLNGGLIVEVGALTEEMRRAILTSRLAAAQQRFPNLQVAEDVVGYVAKVMHGGRDLEGALNRLMLFAHAAGAPISIEIAEREIRDLIRPSEPKRVKIEEIQRVVARAYNVCRDDIMSSRRTANVVRPRQVAMYLAKALTLRSLPDIGRRFGGRDHTTVLHAVRKIETLVGQDTALAQEIEALRKQLME